jgi:hypothetical protein
MAVVEERTTEDFMREQGKRAKCSLHLFYRSIGKRLAVVKRRYERICGHQHDVLLRRPGGFECVPRNIGDAAFQARVRHKASCNADDVRKVDPAWRAGPDWGARAQSKMRPCRRVGASQERDGSTKARQRHDFGRLRGPRRLRRPGQTAGRAHGTPRRSRPSHGGRDQGPSRHLYTHTCQC